jgi:hypothetical protein
MSAAANAAASTAHTASPPSSPPLQQQQRQWSCSSRRNRSQRRLPPQIVSLLLLLLLLVCGLLVPTAVAQQPMPFMGRGDNPPASPVDVYVTAFVDRILSIDDRLYEFTVSLLLNLICVGCLWGFVGKYGQC